MTQIYHSKSIKKVARVARSLHHVATAVTQSMTGFAEKVARLHLKMHCMYYIEK